MTDISRIVLRGLSFQGDGSVVLEYCLPSVDAFRNGVVLNHTLLVPAGAEYDDEIETVRDAVVALIDDVLEDVPHLEPVSFETSENDDENDNEGEDEDDGDDDDDE